MAPDPERALVATVDAAPVTFCEKLRPTGVVFSSASSSSLTMGEAGREVLRERGRGGGALRDLPEVD